MFKTLIHVIILSSLVLLFFYPDGCASIPINVQCTLYYVHITYKLHEYEHIMGKEQHLQLSEIFFKVNHNSYYYKNRSKRKI